MVTELSPETFSLSLSEDYDYLPGPREGVFVHTLCDHPDAGVIDGCVLTRDDGRLVTDHREGIAGMRKWFLPERFISDQRTRFERVSQAKEVTLDHSRLMLCGVAEADIVDAMEPVAGAITQIAMVHLLRYRT